MDQKKDVSKDKSKGLFGNVNSLSPFSSLDDSKKNKVSGRNDIDDSNGTINSVIDDGNDSTLLRGLKVTVGIVLVLLFIFVFVMASLGSDITSYSYGGSGNITSIVSKIKKVRSGYSIKYGVDIDGNLIIAALTVNKDEDAVDVDSVSDYIELLAGYQIVTNTSMTCDSSTMRSIALNGNYKCNQDVLEDTYFLSTARGKLSDDDSGSSFYWNLIDGNFVFDYYRELMPNNDRNSSLTIKKIEQIVKDIYLYYADIKDYMDESSWVSGISCDAVMVTRDDNASSFGNVDDTINGQLYLPIEDYVLGVMLAEVGADGYSKINNSDDLMNYYKAMAVTIRSYTLGKSGGCLKGMPDSNNNQIYDDPSFYENTLYYDLVKDAVTLTSGEVILYNDNVFTSLYDYDKGKNDTTICDSNYCYISYVKMPSNSVSKTKFPVEWKSSSISGSIKGLSTYGAMYLASVGKSYEEIIKTFYSDDIVLSSVYGVPYNYEVDGDYPTWKQTDLRWSSIVIGHRNNGGLIENRTVGQIGCTMTAISIQIARSGTATVGPINPGTFAKACLAAGGFAYNGGISFSCPQNSIAPNFEYAGQKYIFGTAQEKASFLQELINDNYYVILGVKHYVNASGNHDYGHWVALDKVVGSDIYIFDPGYYATNLYDKYTKDNNPKVPLIAVMWKKLD